MADRALVTVITPTYRRHALVLEAVENVRRQTYPNVEHLLVSDGPDPDLRRVLWAAGHRPADLFTDGGPTRLRLVETGKHWTSILRDSYSAAPMVVGQLLARGDYQCWLADDERMQPHHLEMLVDALETHGVDFVYPRVLYYRWDAPAESVGIGCDPPRKGAITHALYRAELLDLGRGPYRTHVGRAGDWEQIERWITYGARWHFVDALTFSHRDDRDCPPERYAAPLPAYANVS